MKVKELIRRLRKERQGLEAKMFVSDQNPFLHDNGDGVVISVFECTNDRGETFVALSA